MSREEVESSGKSDSKLSEYEHFLGLAKRHSDGRRIIKSSLERGITSKMMAGAQV